MLDTIGLQRYARDRMRDARIEAWRAAAVRRARAVREVEPGSEPGCEPYVAWSETSVRGPALARDARGGRPLHLAAARPSRY